MKTHHIPRFAALGAAGLLTCLGQAMAAPVTVDDFSFELTPEQGAGGWSNDLTPTIWIGRDGTNDGDAFIEHIAGFSSDGVSHIGMSTGYYLYQDTGIAWTPETQYSLTVAIGRRGGSTNANNSSAYGVTNVAPLGYANMAAARAGDPVLNQFSGQANAALNDPDLTFVDAPPIVFFTGDGVGCRPSPEGNIFIVVGDESPGARSHFDNIRLDVGPIVDADEDGMPDLWEEQYGLNTAVDDSADDLENAGAGDGLTNIQEYLNCTDPTNPDTDGDGVEDGPEVSGALNTYASGVQSGPPGDPTDPTVPDSDDDGLTDGEEINHPTDKTDPNTADSDGDGFNDIAELAFGSDPNNAAAFPVITGANQVGINFVGGRGNTAPANNTNGGYVNASFTGDNSDVAGVAGTAQNNWNSVQPNNGVNVATTDDSGTAASMLVTWTSPNTWSIEATVDSVFTKPTDADAALMQGYLDNNPTIEISGIPYASYDVIVYFDSDSGTDRSLTFTANGISKDGITNSGDNWDIIGGTGGTFVEGFAPGDIANYVVFNALSDKDLTITSATSGGGPASVQGIQIINASIDSDGGGIPDSTELRMGLDPNDGGVDDVGDLDLDNVSNVDEIANRTNPNLADTDGDGLDDDIEALGDTDPLDADSDDDGFTDGQEDVNENGVVDEGETDPNNEDTDNDTILDGIDTDPLDDNNDQDLDGIGNQDEINGIFNTNFGMAATDFLVADSDGDGLNDLEDINAGSNPNDPDTDLDSLEDGYEVNVSETDPNNIADPGPVANAIGINARHDRVPDAPIAATTLAGHPDYLQTNWNNPTTLAGDSGFELDIESPNGGVLTDSNGAILTDDGTALGNPELLVSWANGTHWSSNNGTGNANSSLMNHYWDAGSTITFTGIPYEFFDVVVYVGSDGNNRTGQVILQDALATPVAQSGYTTSSAFGGFQAIDYVVSTDTTGTVYPAANVVVFPSVSETDITIVNTPISANTGVYAVQIVESGPPVASGLSDLAITQTGPTTFQLTWTGGDGTNTIQVATPAELEVGTWTDVATDVASGAEVVADPGTSPQLFFRVIEPIVVP